MLIAKQKTNEIQNINLSQRTVVTETNIDPKTLLNINFIKKIAVDIASDLIDDVRSCNTKTSDNKYSKALLRTVQELKNKHSITFSGMLNRLNMKLLESPKDVCDCLDRIYQEMFVDNNINWGRIVTVYAFASFTAKYCFDAKKDKLTYGIADYLGTYVSDNFAEWILKNGGWDGFINYFPEEKLNDNKIWQGLLFTFLGLGALASLNWK